MFTLKKLLVITLIVTLSACGGSSGGGSDGDSDTQDPSTSLNPFFSKVAGYYSYFDTERMDVSCYSGYCISGSRSEAAGVLLDKYGSYIACSSESSQSFLTSVEISSQGSDRNGGCEFGSYEIQESTSDNPDSLYITLNREYTSDLEGFENSNAYTGRSENLERLTVNLDHNGQGTSVSIDYKTASLELNQSDVENGESLSESNREYLRISYFNLTFDESNFKIHKWTKPEMEAQLTGTFLANGYIITNNDLEDYSSEFYDLSNPTGFESLSDEAKSIYESGVPYIHKIIVHDDLSYSSCFAYRGHAFFQEGTLDFDRGYTSFSVTTEIEQSNYDTSSSEIDSTFDENSLWLRNAEEIAFSLQYGNILDTDEYSRITANTNIYTDQNRISENGFDFSNYSAADQFEELNNLCDSYIDSISSAPIEQTLSSYQDSIEDQNYNTLTGIYVNIDTLTYWDSSTSSTVIADMADFIKIDGATRTVDYCFTDAERSTDPLETSQGNTNITLYSFFGTDGVQILDESETESEFLISYDEETFVSAESSILSFYFTKHSEDPNQIVFYTRDHEEIVTLTQITDIESIRSNNEECLELLEL